MLAIPSGRTSVSSPMPPPGGPLALLDPSFLLYRAEVTITALKGSEDIGSEHTGNIQYRDKQITGVSKRGGLILTHGPGPYPKTHLQSRG